MAANDFPNENEILSRYRHLLFKFASYLEPSNVEDIKFRYSDRLKGQYESIKNGRDLIRAFETYSPPLIQENDISLLVDIAKDEHFVELEALCDEYKKLEYIFSGKNQAKPEVFIGRDNDIKNIHDAICQQEDQGKMAAVFIHGFPGIGKTRLANEVITQFSIYHRPIFLDLREINTVEAVYYALMNKLDHITIKQHFQMATLVNALFERKQECILLLDNADLLLEPGTAQAPNIVRKSFIMLIKRLLTVNNSRVKLIITSRHNIEDEMYQEQIFLTKLDKMTPQDSQKLIHVYSNYVPIDDQKIYNVAKACGFHPLAMKIVAGRLSNSSTDHIDHIIGEVCAPVSVKTMNTLSILAELAGLESQAEVETCLYQSFEALPNRKLKETLLMLASIPGTFTYNDACEVAKRKEESMNEDRLMVGEHIEVLRKRNLLEFSARETDRKYKMHLLLRAALVKISEMDQSFTMCCKMAEDNFICHYNEKLDTFCKNIEHNHKAAFEEKNVELPNFVGLLMQHKNKMESLPSEQTSTMAVALDYLMSPKERFIYYSDMADAAEKQGFPGKQAEYLSLKGYEMSKLGRHPFPEIQKEFNKALELIKALPDKKSRHFKYTHSVYYRCAGVAHLVVQGKGALQAHRTAVSLLKKSAKLNKELYGCHFLTCRAYMDLASAHFEKEKYTPGIFKRNETELSLKYGFLALEMRNTLGPEHFDTSSIYVDIGSCYENIARYKKALEYYDKALNMAESLNLDNYSHIADIYWNMSTTYRKKRQHDKQYENAKMVLLMKQRDFGNVDHPDIMAAQFLCGLACFELKNTDKAVEHLEASLCISERLMKAGRENSYFWRRLKETYVDVLHYSDKDVEVASLQDRFKDAENALQYKKQRLMETKENEQDMHDDDVHDDLGDIQIGFSPKFKPTELYQPEEELDEEQLKNEEYYKNLPDKESKNCSAS